MPRPQRKEINFTKQNNLNYLAPIVVANASTGSNADFYLGNVSQSLQAAFPSLTSAYSGSLEEALTTGTLSTNVSLDTRKFIVGFQGGFDGAKPNLKKYAGQYITATNTFGFDCSTSTATGAVSYNKAFTLLSNTDYYDMNMLLTPGIIHSLHPYITQIARNMAETRQDTCYVIYLHHQLRVLGTLFLQYVLR